MSLHIRKQTQQQQKLHMRKIRAAFYLLYMAIFDYYFHFQHLLDHVHMEMHTFDGNLMAYYNIYNL